MYSYLEQHEFQEITNKLIDLIPLIQTIKYPLDIYALNFGIKYDNFAIAIACLQDFFDYMIEANLALFEMEAAYKYYNKVKLNNQNKQLKVIYTRFHAENVFLRLYSACEHIANYLMYLYNIKYKDLKKIVKKRDALSVKVGLYFSKNRPKSLITKKLNQLISNNSWKYCLEYRNNWVHNQRKLIKGIPGRYNRKSRWEKDGGGFKIFIKYNGDIPETSIEELMEYSHSSFKIVYQTMKSIILYTVRVKINTKMSRI